MYRREVAMSPNGKSAVTAEFKQLLEEHGLDFRPVRAGLPHRTVYQRAAVSDFSALLLLHLHSYREQFSFEVGWLFRSSFDDIGSCLDATDALRMDAAILPVNVLAGNPGERWRDRREAASVAEAFAEVQSLGLPYLDRVSQAKREGRA